MRVLGQIGDAGVLDTLIAQLNDSSVLVREEAATALSKRADERALEPLVAAFYRVDLDEEEMFPLIVIGTLKRIHTPAAESALLDFLKIMPKHAGDVRYDILKETMITLAEMGSKAAVDPILQAFPMKNSAGQQREH